MLAVAPGVHDFRNHARIVRSARRAATAARASLIVRKATVRVMTVDPTIVPASIARDRSVRAMKAATIVRVATTRTTAKSLRNVQRSEDAALIANESLTTTGAAQGPSRSRRRPANASPK
jgi:hypothetical protein